MFNVPIRSQQGGSELAISSTGSLNVQTGGKQNIDAGGHLEVAVGGSVSINHTGPSTFGLQLVNGASKSQFYMGTDAPTFTAPMGSIYIRNSGSMSGLYVNITQDLNGSTWRGFQQGSAIS